MKKLKEFQLKTKKTHKKAQNHIDDFCHKQQYL